MTPPDSIPVSPVSAATGGGPADIHRRDVSPVGVYAVGLAAPSLRLAGAEVGAAWGAGGGRNTVALCDADEDTLTLAWQAATDAMAAADIPPSEIAGLWWGTARPPFAEGPSLPFLCAALSLRPDVAGALLSGSPHAGMEALIGAWDALSAGHVGPGGPGGRVLVVASDALVPGMGTAGEAVTGAGAVAFIVGADDAAGNGSGPPARLVSRATRSMPVVDRYRGTGGSATADVYDGRLFRDEVFLPLLADTGRALTSPAIADGIAGWAVADPDGKLAAALVKRLGAPLLSADVQGALGDTGAAGGLIGAVPALSGPTPSVVGILGYGGGRATALAVEVRRPVPGSEGALDRLGPGRKVGYIEAVRARGQLEAMVDPIPMGVPPGGAAFVRGNVEMLSLEGARCRACGTVSTPPSIHPTCVGCGGDELDVVSLARRGTVHTFVVNQTMPPPFLAPLPLCVVDLEDGARLMVQGSVADAADMAVDDTVELVLRLYATERDVPVYGYKARRVVSSTDGGRSPHLSTTSPGSDKEVKT